MMPRSVARLARMDRAEVAWRGKAAARKAIDRVRGRFVEPRWNRDDLLAALESIPELAAARHALAARAWDDAHRALSDHFASAPQRFVVGPSARGSIAARVRSEFPQSVAQAVSRADRILAGEYDLLAFRGLRFGAGPLPDWHLDPALNRRPPLAFWASVPYLDPAYGDHKMIWELNRHQHWLALGRAYWLSDDARYRARCLAELRSWIDANPPLTGINWASMLELGFRSISWIWAINFFAAGGEREASPWLVDLLAALDRQLAHIERNLSYYFSPNTHLLGEALALYVAGSALPELAASPRRRALGRTILLEEIGRQIGADGGHLERSTHYHRYTLDFYELAAIVARLTGDAAAAAFDGIVARLAAAARLLADARGRIPHIGDDDGGALTPIAGRAPDDLRDSLAIAAAIVRRRELQIGRAPEEAIWMLHGLGVRAVECATSSADPIRSAALPDTGYYVSRSAAGDHLVVDGGAHGYQNGGHAHADALSLTLSVRGLPLLIDPGTGCYTIDPVQRDRLRSTALHNTLTLDDAPQSVARGPFHWARVADAHVARWRTNDAFDYFDGAHDGYAPIEHRRHVLALHGDLVVVADLVAAPAASDGAWSASTRAASAAGSAHAAAVHWHIDPRWTVDARGRQVTFTRAGERVGLAVPHGLVEAFVGDEATGLGWYSPAYGRVDRTTTIRVSHSAAAPFWIVSVFDLNPLNPVADVDWVPVWAEAGAMAHATAVRITRVASVDYVSFAEPAADPDAAAIAPSVKSPFTWRVADFETDARMLFCRMTSDRPIARLAIVDGSVVRTAGRRGFHLALPRPVPDLHVDLAADARVAGPGFGARLMVGGREQPMARDRRAMPRR